MYKTRVAIVAAIGLAVAVSPLSATDYQIPLNYNFNGMVHNGETGAPDAPAGFRSMSDRALRVNGLAGGFGTTPILGKTCLPYTIVTAAGVLDMVHLGNRNTVDFNNWAFDAVPDGDNIGIQPGWLADPDQSGPQTTTLAAPITLDATAEIGIIYDVSNGGGFFDVTLDFSDLSTVTVVAHGPDWFQNQFPLAPEIGADAQAQLGVFTGTGSVDSGSPSANLNVAEMVISVPDLLNDFALDIGGKQLTAISFSNRSNTAAGYAIYAATVRTGITPPANDECANCIPLTLNPLSASAAGATGQFDLSSCGANDNRDVWFCYDAAADGLAVARLSGSTYNTTAAVYDACDGFQIACNDDSDGQQAIVAWNVLSGTSYYIRVAGVNNTRCNIMIDLDFTQIPSNDECNACIPVTEGTYNGSTIGGSGASVSCVGNDPIDVWYCYEAGQTGTARASTCGSTYDTTIAVYDACGGAQLACNDDSAVCGTTASSVNWAATVGSTYFIRISGWDGAVGDFTLTLANPGDILAGPIVNPANGHAYYLLTPMSWTDSESRAVTLGGHLATINDAEENEWVRLNVVGFDLIDRSAWIGFNDIAVEGTFEWVSGEPVTYTNWNIGEPNNAGVGEHVTQFLGLSGLWNDNADVATGGVQVFGVVEVGAVSLPGDLNCDNVVNNLDIGPFALALVDPAAHAAAFPGCNINRADLSGDSVINGTDVSGFVDVLLP